MLLRWHQAVTAEAWAVLDGKRVQVRDWIGFRDRAWGVRMNVGIPAPDLRIEDRHGSRFRLRWSPLVFLGPDGSPTHEIHHYVQDEDGERVYFSAYRNDADGSQTVIHDVRDRLRFHPANRRLLGGTVEFDLGWGATRSVEVTPLGDTGFHLGPSGYFHFKGKAHGSWLGDEFLDGERYDDVSDPATARQVHQLRDCPVHVRDGDADGFGIVETILTGGHPEYGLDQASSFL
jgi:hypothetical protein